MSTEATEAITVTPPIVDPELQELSGIPHEEALQLLETPATEATGVEKPNKLSRYQRMQRKNIRLVAVIEEQNATIAALRAENEKLREHSDGDVGELKAELDELRDLHAIALQNLDLYRRRFNTNPSKEHRP